MTREINPKDTSRALAYELWLNAPNPMVTLCCLIIASVKQQYR